MGTKQSKKKNNIQLKSPDALNTSNISEGKIETPEEKNESQIMTQKNNVTETTDVKKQRNLSKKRSISKENITIKPTKAYTKTESRTSASSIKPTKAYKRSKRNKGYEDYDTNLNYPNTVDADDAGIATTIVTYPISHDEKPRASPNYHSHSHHYSPTCETETPIHTESYHTPSHDTYHHTPSHDTYHTSFDTNHNSY